MQKIMFREWDEFGNILKKVGPEKLKALGFARLFKHLAESQFNGFGLILLPNDDSWGKEFFRRPNKDRYQRAIEILKSRRQLFYRVWIGPAKDFLSSDAPKKLEMAAVILGLDVRGGMKLADKFMQEGLVLGDSENVQLVLPHGNPSNSFGKGLSPETAEESLRKLWTLKHKSPLAREEFFVRYLPCSLSDFWCWQAELSRAAKESAESRPTEPPC